MNDNSERCHSQSLAMIILLAAQSYFTDSIYNSILFIANSIMLYTANLIFTTRKRSLQRLCFYRCLSVHRGVSHQGDHLVGRPPGRETPWQGDPPSRETPQQGDPPGRRHPPGRRYPLGRRHPLAGRPPQEGGIPQQGDPLAGRPPGKEAPPGRRHPLGRRHSPGRETRPTATAAGGTHPTGMHSLLIGKSNVAIIVSNVSFYIGMLLMTPAVP